MHGADGGSQTIISKSSHQAGRGRRFSGRAKRLDQQHFQQMLKHDLARGSLRERLVV